MEEKPEKKPPRKRTPRKKSTRSPWEGARRWFPATQRTIVLTFNSIEDAVAWDRTAPEFMDLIARAFRARAKLLAQEQNEEPEQ